MRTLFLVLALLPAPLFAADFHAAKTPTEKTLDGFLARANKDNHQLDNLFFGRGEDGFKPSVDYKEILTSGLLDTLRAYEDSQVKENCGGDYQLGDMCGIDFSPITCDQDTPEEYVYRTVSETKEEAIIERQWIEADGSDPVIYTLFNDGKTGWRIDAVSCETMDFESDRKI